MIQGFLMHLLNEFLNKNLDEVMVREAGEDGGFLMHVNFFIIIFILTFFMCFQVAFLPFY